MRRKLNRHYTYIYAILGATVVGVELAGVFGDAKGDTISEHYWWLAEAAPTPWLVHVPMLAFFAWLIPHFIRRK